MDKNYYLIVNDKVTEALSFEELITNVIKPDTLICKKYDNWKPAEKIPEINAFFGWTMKTENTNMPYDFHNEETSLQLDEIANSGSNVSQTQISKNVSEETVSNNNPIVIILSSVIIAAFFMPWIKYFVSINAFDIVFGEAGNITSLTIRYLLSFIPLVSVVILVGAINNYHYSFPKGILYLSPLACLLIALMSTLSDLGGNSGDFTKILGLGFWLTLIGSIILPFCSFTTYLEESNNNDLSQNNDIHKQETKSISNSSEFKLQQSSLNTEPFDISMWIKENKHFILRSIALFIIAALVLISYFLFFQPNPEIDGKKAASSVCDCIEKNNEAFIGVNNDFVKSFNKANYRKRSEARNRLIELQNTLIDMNNKCHNQAQNEIDNMRNKYLNNESNLKLFDLSFSSQQNNCSPSNSNDLNVSNIDAEDKIKSIVEPEPDLDKIKGDLIGQTIPGWKFEFLSEFKEVEILRTDRGIDRIEYQIKCHLLGSSYEHDCEIKCAYVLAVDDWVFSDVKLDYITYDNNIPSDAWASITPLKNCTFHVDDKHKLLWKTSSWSWHSDEVMTGPDVPDITLPTSDKYFIKSREGHPILVRFTYKPYN